MASIRLVVLAVLVVAVHGIFDPATQDGKLKYDCRYDGGVCINNGGTCDYSTGGCTCSAASTGVWCAADPAGTCSAADEALCPAGYCKVDLVGTAFCECPDGEFATVDENGAPVCQDKIVLDCETTPGKHAVTIHLEENANFQGHVYFMNSPDQFTTDTACKLPAQTGGSTISYTMNSNLGPGIGDCSTGLAIDGTTSLTFADYTATGDYLRYLYVQRENMVLSDADILMMLKCSPSDDGKTVISSVTMLTNTIIPDPSIFGNVYYQFGGGKTLEFFFKYVTGSASGPALAPATPYDVGTLLYVFIYKITPDTSHPKWLLKMMIASPRTLGSPDTPPAALADYTVPYLVLMDDGCATPVAQNVLLGMQPVSTEATTYPVDGRPASSLEISVRMFRFPGKDVLTFDFHVMGCTAESTLCDTACSYSGYSADPPARRRKRRVTDDEKVPDQFQFPSNVTINIHSPSSERSNSWNGGVNVEGDFANCVQSIVFIVPLILLVILVIIAMALAVYFFSKLNRRKTKDEEIHHVSYK